MPNRANNMPSFDRLVGVFVEQAAWVKGAATHWRVWAFAATASVVAKVPLALTLLIILATVDVALGVAAAFLRRDLSKTAILDGFVRKVILLVGVAVGFVLDMMLQPAGVQIPGLGEVAPSAGTFLASLAIGKEVLSILDHLRSSGALRSRALNKIVDRLRAIDDAEIPRQPADAEEGK